MAIIRKVRGFTPKIGEGTFLADNAAIIGDVEIGNDCSIWFGTVLRGDVNSIRIGNRVNVQDGSVLHAVAVEQRFLRDTVLSKHSTVLFMYSFSCTTTLCTVR